jgi:cytochrome c oxidase subunit 2
LAHEETRRDVDTRSDFGGLWHTYLGVAGVVLVAVFAAVAVALVRSRRGAGHGVENRPRLELAYAIVLAVIAAALVGFTFHTEAREDRVEPAPTTVDVVAFKWGWAFTAGGRTIAGDDRAPPTLTVPAGRPIRFVLRSRDVIHAFWVPALRFKRDAFPFRPTQFDLVFDHPGTYVGRCAEFCGLQHAGMTFQVRAT